MGGAAHHPGIHSWKTRPKGLLFTNFQCSIQKKLATFCNAHATCILFCWTTVRPGFASVWNARESLAGGNNGGGVVLHRVPHLHVNGMARCGIRKLRLHRRGGFNVGGCVVFPCWIVMSCSRAGVNYALLWLAVFIQYGFNVKEISYNLSRTSFRFNIK